MAQSTRTNKWSSGCLILFALPFAAVGVGMTFWRAHLLMQHAAMQSWIEVPATIKSAELKANHGEDGTTYKAVAVYDYEFGGRKFTGERVGIDGGSDNVGSFQQDAYHELKRHLDQGQPFHCYVDPEKPSESVLYRKLRGEMLAFYTLFATVFGSMGLGLIVGGLLVSRPESKLLPDHIANLPTAPTWNSKDETKDQPWLARADWASGQIKANGGATLPVLITVAIYWNIAQIPLLLKLREILQQGHGWGRWMALAFPTIGVLLVSAIAYQWFRNRKFGKSVLQLASVPGVIGGQLAGVVRIAKPVETADGFRLILTCVESVQSGEDKKNVALWQDERILSDVMHDSASGETAVPVLFAIPYECAETSLTGATRDISWQLEASAKTTGINYKSQFDVPVFKTADSRPDFVLDATLSADYNARPSNEFLLSDAGIFKEPLPGNGVRLIFPAARNIGTASALTGFLAIWCAAIWGMSRAGAPILFPIVFGLFGLILVLVVLDLWLYRSVIDATQNELTVRGGPLGIGRRRTFEAANIKRFDTKEDMSSGTATWKSVVLEPHTGRKRTLAKGIRSKLALDAVIDELNTALGRNNDANKG